MIEIVGLKERTRVVRHGKADWRYHQDTCDFVYFD